MVFNSYPFIFLFLPAVLLGYFATGRYRNRGPVIWLVVASVAFYAFGNRQFVPLLLVSIAFNYVIGLLLIAKKPRPGLRLAVLATGVGGDLLMLGIFKYAGFFAVNLNALFSTALTANVLLPVGISFYTFTQVALLVEAYRGKVTHYALPHYALFVSYFPHLIAGPILHHRDMIPQFERAESKRPDAHLILCGLMIFAIGLFKKTCLADGIQPLVALAFGPKHPSFDQAWIGTLAYNFPALFRLLRLFRHGDRNFADVRHLPAAQFQRALQGHQHHRLLAALAHDAVAVPARLSLYPAWRQPPWTDAPLCQPHAEPPHG
jgi:alginate O-acetyltransferase complex protein AlgI